jgi:hypothetical protein
VAKVKLKAFTSGTFTFQLKATDDGGSTNPVLMTPAVGTYGAVGTCILDGWTDTATNAYIQLVLGGSSPTGTFDAWIGVLPIQ